MLRVVPFVWEGKKEAFVLACADPAVPVDCAMWGNALDHYEPPPGNWTRADFTVTWEPTSEGSRTMRVYVVGTYANGTDTLLSRSIVGTSPLDPHEPIAWKLGIVERGIYVQPTSILPPPPTLLRVNVEQPFHAEGNLTFTP